MTTVKTRAQQQVATTATRAAHATGVARQRLADSSPRRTLMAVAIAAVLVGVAFAVDRRRC